MVAVHCAVHIAVSHCVVTNESVVTKVDGLSSWCKYDRCCSIARWSHRDDVVQIIATFVRANHAVVRPSRFTLL